MSEPAARKPGHRCCDECALTLPWPPSVNHYWLHCRRGPNAGRAFLSPKARKYRKTVALLWLEAGKPRFDGPVAITIRAFPPDRRKRDIDNLPKGILDSLEYAGLFADDYSVARLTVERCEPVKDGRVEVEIQAEGGK